MYICILQNDGVTGTTQPVFQWSCGGGRRELKKNARTKLFWRWEGHEFFNLTACNWQVKQHVKMYKTANPVIGVTLSQLHPALVFSCTCSAHWSVTFRRSDMSEHFCLISSFCSWTKGSSKKRLVFTSLDIRHHFFRMQYLPYKDRTWRFSFNTVGCCDHPLIRHQGASTVSGTGSGT